MPKICKGTKADGTPCTAPALRTSEFCFFHAPEMAKRRKQAQSDGGSKRAQAPVRVLPPPPPEFDLGNKSDILRLRNYAVELFFEVAWTHRGSMRSFPPAAVPLVIMPAN